MEQADSIELLDPDGKLAALFEEPEPEPVPPNIHGVRVATPDDVADMEEVEHLAFPTLFPPTRFRREVDKTNTLYLLATRDWTPDELALGPGAIESQSDGGGVFGALGNLVKLPGRILFQTIGGRSRPMPPQYVVGLVGLWYVMDEAHIVIIGNRPGDRRKGIGELLLIAAVDAATAHGCRVVTLEVRASNKAARALYHKYGFREVGIRRRYYADNNEDAVIMTTPPVQSDEYKDHFQKQVSEHESRWGQSSRRIA